MFLSSKKEFNRLAFKKKNEHLKHNFFCPRRRIRLLKNHRRGHKRSECSSLSLSLCVSLLGSSLKIFSLLSGEYILSSRALRRIYFLTRETHFKVVVKNKLVRAIKHATEDARLKRNAKCSLCRTSSLPSFGFCVEGDAKEEL